MNVQVFNRLLWERVKSDEEHLREWAVRECGRQGGAVLADILLETPEALGRLDRDRLMSERDDGSSERAGDWYEIRFDRMRTSAELMAPTEEVLMERGMAARMFKEMVDRWATVYGEVDFEKHAAIQYSLNNALAYARLLCHVNALFLRHYRNEEIDQLPELLENVIESKRHYDELYGLFATDDLRPLIREVRGRLERADD